MATSYAPFQIYFSKIPKTIDEITLTFQQIEEILGDKLPNSAYTHRPWWANRKKVSDRVQAKAWMNNGFKVKSVLLDGNEKNVSFVRVSYSKRSENERSENTRESRTLLEGQEAINLWLDGESLWNKWVMQNPNADIDLSNVDFTEQVHVKDRTIISFSKYKFPNGEINFESAKFGSGITTFESAIFGNGRVNFHNVNFSEQNVLFLNTNFGHGDVIFSFCKFGNKLTTFDGATFNSGEVNFVDAIFPGGSVFFTNARFENVMLNFGDAIFAGENLYFNDSIFVDSSIFLGNSIFKCSVDLDIDCKANLALFSLSKSTFEKSLTLPQKFLSCVIDLQGAKLNHPVSLHKLNCSSQVETHYWGVKRAKDPEDAARFRRLKELATANKDHDRALNFHANEMRAKRWHEFGILASLLDMAYSAVSNYGQSIMRPFSILTIILFAVTNLHSYIAGFDKWLSALELTLVNTLPFISSAKSIREDAVIQLYGANVPDWLNLLSIGQSVLVFVFLFFLGLGLRNKFRI